MTMNHTTNHFVPLAVMQNNTFLISRLWKGEIYTHTYMNLIYT